MRSKLPPITDLQRCPHCGCDEFAVKQAYNGSGSYYRRMDGREGADNAGMYDCLNVKTGKLAYCARCEKPIGRWDEHEHSQHYNIYPSEQWRGGRSGGA